MFRARVPPRLPLPRLGGLAERIEALRVEELPLRGPELSGFLKLRSLQCRCRIGDLGALPRLSALTMLRVAVVDGGGGGGRSGSSSGGSSGDSGGYLGIRGQLSGSSSSGESGGGSSESGNGSSESGGGTGESSSGGTESGGDSSSEGGGGSSHEGGDSSSEGGGGSSESGDDSSESDGSSESGGRGSQSGNSGSGEDSQGADLMDAIAAVAARMPALQTLEVAFQCRRPTYGGHWGHRTTLTARVRPLPHAALRTLVLSEPALTPAEVEGLAPLAGAPLRRCIISCRCHRAAAGCAEALSRLGLELLFGEEGERVATTCSEQSEWGWANVEKPFH
jgi:hypothetical protein